MRTLRNSRGITIIGIMMLLVAVLVYAAVIPIIITQINAVLPDLDTSAATMASLIPLFMIIAIIITAFQETQPQYGPRY